MLQVAKPVESIKQCKCGRKDNSWDFVNLRDRIKSFFGIVHGTSDASLALTFVCAILIPVFIIVVFSIVPFPTFGPVHHNASFWRVIWRLARRCSANIQFRIQQKKSKVWLTLPYVFLKAFKKCRRGERKRNRGNPFAIVAAAASLSILYVNKCIIIVLENLPKCLNIWILVPKTKKENVLEKFGQFWTKDNFLVNFKGTIFDVLGQFGSKVNFGTFWPFWDFF